MSYTTIHERVSLICPVCGNTFSLCTSEYRRKIKLNKVGIFCSHKCYGVRRAELRAELKASIKAEGATV